TLLVNPEGAGEVFGAGDYEEGTFASVNAVANEGWVFVNWTDTEDNIISEMPANDIPMTADLTLIANFEEEVVIIDPFILTLLVNPEGAGEVFGAGVYEEGETASVNAVPNEGWLFVNWTDLEGNVISEMPANDITITGDLTLIANFMEEPVDGELIVNIEVTGVTCPGDDDGSIFVSVTGGQKPYNICLSFGCDTEGVFDKTQTAHYGGLLPGYYQITIVDANGLTFEECVWVPEPDPITVEVELDAPLCFEEEMTATATYTISGGTMPYTFDGEPVEGNTVVVVYDEEGTFSHMINDANDCGPVEVEVTIEFPVALEASVEYDPILCFGETTLVDVLAEGGTGTLSLYDVVEGELVFVSELPLEAPLALGAGEYSWVVMDENECEFPLDFEIVQPDELEAEVVYEPIACYDGTTMVDVEAMGGTGTLSLYDVVDDELVFVSELPLEAPLALGAGTYSWVVMDENGCQVPLDFTLTQPDLLEAVVIDQMDPTCFEGTDGYVVIEIFGGTPPYFPGFGELEGNILTLSNLSAGAGMVSITDSKNCGPAEVEFELGEPDPVVVNLEEVMNVLCYGDATGSILVTATGGTGEFMFSLDGEVFQDSGLFEDLLAGEYTVYALDENGCLGMLEGIVITQPDELLVDLTVTNVSCFGADDGQIMGYITGGVGPYNVCLFTQCDEDPDKGEFDPAKGQGFLHWNLVPGEYMIVVTDQNGCQWMECVTIEEPEPFGASFTDLVDLVCNGDDTGEVTIVFEGGTMPYNLSWEGQETFDIEGSSYTITGLTAGDYTIYADDANGCGPVVLEFSCLEPAMPLSLEESEVGNVSCNGGSDGYIQLFPVGGVGEYTVSGDLEALFTQGLMAGIYEFTVTDENGCQVMGSEVITEPEPLTVTIEIEDLVCEGDGVEVYASDWIWYRQGLTNAGNLPNADRSDPEQVIGEPVYGDVLGTFFSLGFGGEMIVKFDAPIANGPGNDLLIVETTFGNQTCATYPEKVDVWVAQYINEELYTPIQGEIDVLGLGDEWIYLGQGCLDAEFDFGALPWVQYVYMKDVSDPDDFANSQTSDGYDINGLVALNGSLVVSANLMAMAEGGTLEYTFLWSTDETNAMINVSAPGLYTVWVTDANGCMTEATVEVYCGEYMVDEDDKLFADDPISGYMDILNSKVFPNPFRSEATIEFTLARNTKATVYLYNLAGERVALLFEGNVNAFETQQVRFGSENLNSGVYFYHLNTGSEVYINKVVLVK
ncbi:MAG: T9SS C-terminal target domain-containing protein, partial [Bacteroidetes bacterium]